MERTTTSPILTTIETDDAGNWRIEQSRRGTYWVCREASEEIPGWWRPVAELRSPLEAADCVRARIEGGYY